MSEVMAKVHTAVNRGFTAQEIADRALDKIIYVGDKSHPALLEQAHAFRDSIRNILVHYLDEAQRNERITIQIRLRQQGFPEIADFIGRI